MKLGTFIIIPEVCLRIFPNFSNTEVAFKSYFTKVVALQKEVITYLWSKALKNNFR